MSDVRAEDLVLEVRRVGDAVGVILPAELLRRLGVGEGDTLRAVEQAGGLVLNPANPKRARAMELARKAFADYADTYRELAK